MHMDGCWYGSQVGVSGSESKMEQNEDFNWWHCECEILGLEKGFLRWLLKMPTSLFKISTGLFEIPTGLFKLPTGLFKLPIGSFKIPYGSFKMPTGLLKIRTGLFVIPTGLFEISICYLRYQLVYLRYQLVVWDELGIIVTRSNTEYLCRFFQRPMWWLLKCHGFVYGNPKMTVHVMSRIKWQDSEAEWKELLFPNYAMDSQIIAFFDVSSFSLLMLPVDWRDSKNSVCYFYNTHYNNTTILAGRHQVSC